MYLQCVEILAKFRIAKFGIRALLIQNRNERGVFTVETHH